MHGGTRQENIIGKRGTNLLHGNLLYNYNDAMFNANSFFKNYGGTPRGRADANQYGGAIGGPVVKNKLFFSSTTTACAMPCRPRPLFQCLPAAFQQYTLLHVPTTSVPLYQQAFALYNGAPGINRAVPVTTGNGITQDPSGSLGCSGLGTFAGTPAPGGGTFGVNVPCAQSWVSANNSLNTESLLIARADYEINSKQKINFRYEYDVGVQATSTSPINPAFSSVSHQPQHQGQLNHTWIITPNLVNNFIGGASWYTAILRRCGISQPPKNSSQKSLRSPTAVLSNWE